MNNRKVLFFVVAAFVTDLYASNLVEASPFSLPVNVVSLTGDAERSINSTSLGNSRFRLKGIVHFDGRYTFSIFDTQTEVSEWLDVGKSIGGFIIVDFDPISLKLSYSFNGNHGDISLYEGSLSVGSASAPFHSAVRDMAASQQKKTTKRETFYSQSPSRKKNLPLTTKSGGIILSKNKTSVDSSRAAHDFFVSEAGSVGFGGLTSLKDRRDTQEDTSTVSVNESTRSANRWLAPSMR